MVRFKSAYCSWVRCVYVDKVMKSGDADAIAHEARSDFLGCTSDAPCSAGLDPLEQILNTYCPKWNMQPNEKGVLVLHVPDGRSCARAAPRSRDPESKNSLLWHFLTRCTFRPLFYYGTLLQYFSCRHRFDSCFQSI